MKPLRHSLLLLAFLLVNFFARADKVMWLPVMLDSAKIAEMQRSGLKLTAEDIYSINNSSLKDAVLKFGRGCTGEVISNQGLILTNHHCGYGSIQSLSSVQKDYLKNGFWAMNNGEELPVPGLIVEFVVRIEDVTEKILANVTAGMAEKNRAEAVRQASQKLEGDIVKGTHYEARVYPFYNGNQYFVLITETFKDIRLVGAPPSSIGKFGGDTDNWEWPRHTGDFAMFRIYAGADNQPAEYSADNKPFKPRQHLKVSAKGVKEGDFTMVYGFPARTQMYLPSHAVEQTLELTDPTRIKIRDKKLEIINEAMRSSDELRIKYASKQSSIANGWKKWIGEIHGLKTTKALEKKRKFERDFKHWVQASETRQQKYGQILQQYGDAYAEIEDPHTYYLYLAEAAFGAEMLAYAYRFNALVEKIESEAPQEEIDKALNNLKSSTTGFYKDFDKETDRRLFVAMMKMIEADLPAEMKPEYYRSVKKKYKTFGDFSKWLYNYSFFSSKERADALLANNSGKKLSKLISHDPAYKMVMAFYNHYANNFREDYAALNNRISELDRLYMAAQMEMSPEQLYPDANFTLRITYGKVEGFKPEDGVWYSFSTDISGIMEKANTGNPDYEIPEKLRQLYSNKDFGPYGKDGKLPVCFIASNHTTGGNSGSPVLNGEGHLIGLNFDRNWQGTMSDIYYDETICRNISVDVRYILFIVDKFAGAGHLVQEMDLVK